jgi:hypothetical protein
MQNEPDRNPQTPRPDDRKRCDDAMSRLFNHCPKALALHKEGKRLKREQNRKEWYAKHGGGK